MWKRITKQGNSYALIIDKHLRSAMALGPSRWVNVQLSGGRLVVEPVSEEKVRARDEARAKEAASAVAAATAGKILRELIDRVSVEELRRLHPRFRGDHLILLFGDDAQMPDYATVIERFRVYLEAFETSDRATAIELALERVPLVVTELGGDDGYEDEEVEQRDADAPRSDVSTRS